MAVGFSNTNKPINPRGLDASPKGYNRAALYSGKALDFDGVNDYVTTPNISVQSSNVWTYTSNIVFNSATSYWFDARQSNIGYSVYFDSSIKKLILYTTSGTIFNFEFEFSKWYNIALTSNSTTASLYVNGELVDSQNYTNSFSVTGDFYIGTRHSLGSYFNGSMSGFKAFDVALTAAQVADLYNNPEKIVPTGVDESNLKLWLPMMEGAGTTAYDGSGNGNHGTISGATWTHGVGSPVAQTAVIDWNKYSITDATDYANVSSTTIANEGTIVFKHVPLASITAGYFTFYGAASTGEGRAIRQNGTKYSFVGFGSSPQDFDTSKNVEVGKITNVAYSWNASGDVKVYIDGVKVGDANKTLYPLTSSSFNINRRVDGIQYHNEIMFYAGLYDEVLTESQIQDIQDGTTNPESVSGLVHFWRNSNNWQDEVGSADLTENDNAGKVLFPQTLTSGRDLAGNIFANVRKQGALNLDGNSWAEVHDNASLDFGTGSFSLECWSKAKYENTGSAYNVLLTLGGNISTQNTGSLYYDSSLRLVFRYDSVFIVTNSQSIGDWSHVVGVYDGANINIYLNGVFVTQTAVVGGASKTNTFAKVIGSDDTAASRTHKDQIAQPRIYNRALTASEVLRNYNSGKSTYQ